MSIFLIPSRIDHYKTDTVAAYSFFKISKKDSASLHLLLETVSVHSTHISTTAFINQYCGNYGELFGYLWNRYFNSLPVGLVVNVPTADVQTAESPGDIQAPPLRQQFLCFLLFIFSLKDAELVNWLYWLHFVQSKKSPDPRLLVAMVDILWGRGESVRYKRKQHRAKVERLLRGVEIDEICPNKLRMLDLRSGGAWSTPLILMRKVIKKLSALYVNGFCWSRVTAAVRSTSQDVAGAYEALRDHWAPSLWAQEDPVVSGERRAARKHLRQFLRSYREYLSMPLDTEFNTLAAAANADLAGRASTLRGLFGPLLALFWPRQSAQVAPEFHRDDGEPTATTGMEPPSKTPTSSLWRGVVFGVSGVPSKTAARYSDGGPDDRSLTSSTPLEIVHKAAVSAPLSAIYAQSHSAQLRAKELLTICDEEIALSSGWGHDGGASFSQSTIRQNSLLSTATGQITVPRATREVVVDVSSSSSSDSGDGSRSSDGSAAGASVQHQQEEEEDVADGAGVGEDEDDELEE